MPRSAEQIRQDLIGFVEQSYPEIAIRIEPWSQDPQRLAIYCTDALFAEIYPYQRWHYLTHLIPQDYYEQHLADTIWYELAPGESPDDLRYPDEQLIDEITPDVMKCIVGSGFLARLDDVMCPVDTTTTRGSCFGDFRHSRLLLIELGFAENELFDVFHVLMRQGGFCDCEILYNIADDSRLQAEYRQARGKDCKPDHTSRP